MLLFSLWLVFTLLSSIPYLSESLIDYSDMDETVVSHLKFPSDGKRGHYYVERYDKAKPGLIDVEYTTSSNSLEVTCTNIKVLRIYCREMYEKKSEDVFKRDPNLDSNYYKVYFIERDHFYVHVNTRNMITELAWLDTPIPYNVTVNGREWWLTGINYTYKNNGIVLTKVPPGNNYVDLYFKSNGLYGPVAKFTVDRDLIGVGESVTFNASQSYDPDGQIVSYVWDLGEGTYNIGETTTHTFTTEGNYNVILTVYDKDDLIDRAFKEIKVVSRVMNISKSVDKLFATPGGILTYTITPTLNSAWTAGVKDVTIKDSLAEELEYLDADPVPQLKDNTLTWRLGYATTPEDLEPITLRASVVTNVENNTKIYNFAILEYSSVSGQPFPQELTNLVSTKVNINTILAPRIKSPVPNINLMEDDPPYHLALNSYEFD
ncbi:PKD domain-containing protein, partial [[Eubacterium] cellulosolvens]